MKKESNTTVKKNIMKLEKLQNLVCEMLKNTENIALRSLHIFSIFVLHAQIVTIFGSKMVTISARNTNVLKICQTTQGYIFCILRHFVKNFNKI